MSGVKGRRRLAMRPWVRELARRESFTALDAEALARAAGETPRIASELVSLLRNCRELDVVAVGFAPYSSEKLLCKLVVRIGYQEEGD